MRQTPDFDPKTAAKKLLREGRSGALATLMAGTGDHYCSLVNVATAADGAPLLLISRLAVHTKNVLADPRVSLMIDELGRFFGGHETLYDLGSRAIANRRGERVVLR